MGHVRSMRARVPRRRGVCARVGVLVDVRGAAGEGLDSALVDDAAGERFMGSET